MVGRGLRAIAWTALVVVTGGCGARTGLHVADRGSEVAAPDGADEASADAWPDEPRRDVPHDAPTPCADGTENVFVLGTLGQLYAFDPASSSSRFIANVPCAAEHHGFNSMAVARDGTAYAAANDGLLVLVSTRDGSCFTTAFSDPSFGVFCMGFSLQGIDDVLYLSDCHSPQSRLGRVDTTTFQLTILGPMDPRPEDGVELTGDRDGHVFGMWNAMEAIAVARIDPVTAALFDVIRLPFRAFDAFAFARWGGSFYFFVDGRPGSDVVRYRPSDRSYSIVTHVPVQVVGAGVSTCAPGE